MYTRTAGTFATGILVLVTTDSDPASSAELVEALVG
jgi:hypothetical protein